MRRAHDDAVPAGLKLAQVRSIRESWKRALFRSRIEPLASVGTLIGLSADLADKLRARPEPRQ